MKGIITQTNHNRCKQLKKPTLTIYRGEQSKTKQIQITFKTQLKNHSKIAVEQHWDYWGIQFVQSAVIN